MPSFTRQGCIGCVALLLTAVSPCVSRGEPLWIGDRTDPKKTPGTEGRNFDWSRPSPADILPNPERGVGEPPRLRDLRPWTSSVEFPVQKPQPVERAPDNPALETEPAPRSRWARPVRDLFVQNPASGAGTRPYVRSVAPGTALNQGRVKDYDDKDYQDTSRTVRKFAGGRSSGDADDQDENDAQGKKGKPGGPEKKSGPAAQEKGDAAVPDSRMSETTQDQPAFEVGGSDQRSPGFETYLVHLKVATLERGAGVAGPMRRLFEGVAPERPQAAPRDMAATPAPEVKRDQQAAIPVTAVTAPGEPSAVAAPSASASEREPGFWGRATQRIREGWSGLVAWLRSEEPDNGARLSGLPPSIRGDIK